MANSYNQKKTDLARLIEGNEFPQPDLLLEFCSRFCSHPFPKSDGTLSLWLSLWPKLSESGRAVALKLPNPCLNHIESRYRKPERARSLDNGLAWILEHDEEMFLEGLRLYPHALCRTAETIGSLSRRQWEKLEKSLWSHRLWSVPKDLSEKEFWLSAERLLRFRDLPQSLLDHFDMGCSTESARVEDFTLSLQRFLLRKRIEKIRSLTYEAQRVHSAPRVIGIGSHP